MYTQHNPYCTDHRKICKQYNFTYFLTYKSLFKLSVTDSFLFRTFNVLVFWFYLSHEILVMCTLSLETLVNWQLESGGGGGGVLPKKLGRGVRPASQNPYPIK